jgi:hypothetical protein
MADGMVNENYHTEADVVFAAIEQIPAIQERTIIIVPGMDSWERIEVTP